MHSHVQGGWWVVLEEVFVLWSTEAHDVSIVDECRGFDLVLVHINAIGGALIFDTPGRRCAVLITHCENACEEDEKELEREGYS